jgi:hypothetical protein
MKTLFKCIGENSFKLIEVTPGGEEYEMTKKEEQYSFNYLLRQLLPQMIRDTYMRFVTKFPSQYPEIKYPRVTPQMVSKTIKKKRADRSTVEYESIISDRVQFIFLIKKGLIHNGLGNETRIIKAGCQGPINNDWKWYDIKGL